MHGVQPEPEQHAEQRRARPARRPGVRWTRTSRCSQRHDAQERQPEHDRQRAEDPLSTSLVLEQERRRARRAARRR